jgi:hypothetical protein
MTGSASENGRPRWKQGISCVTLIVIFVVVGLAQSATGHRTLSHLGLWAPPEPFTALSFTDPLHLGKVGQYGPARVPVAFTIANRRHRATSYRWQIQVGSTTRVIGMVTIPAGGSANVEHRVLVPCRRPPYDRKTRRVKRIPPSRKQVTVLLTGHVQSIDFWEQCVG